MSIDSSRFLGAFARAEIDGRAAGSPTCPGNDGTLGNAISFMYRVATALAYKRGRQVIIGMCR